MVYMKKQMLTGLIVIACAAFCAAVLPRSAEVGSLPAAPVKTSVSAEIEARSEEVSPIFISVGVSAPEAELVSKSEPEVAMVTAEKEIEKLAPTLTAQQVKPSASSLEPYNGDVRVVDGEKQVYLLGFGWIKDEGGGNVGTMVGNPGDELTGNKVGVMGGGTTIDGKGDINKQVGRYPLLDAS
jgi:hypothetical protein